MGGKGVSDVRTKDQLHKYTSFKDRNTLGTRHSLAIHLCPNSRKVALHIGHIY